MHINPMKAAVARGELQIGTWVNLVRNPAILTLLKNAGLDFARIDMEHSALSIESLADMAMLARALEFPIAVRPPHANREWITRVLERNKFANDQVHVTVMFETDEAFNDLDAIAATDGIDALTLGPTDLAQNLGVFGKPEMNKVLDERRDLILAAAKKHGKTCAMLVGSQEQAQQWKEAGVLLLVYKSEVEILANGFRDAMKAIRG